MLEIRYCFKRDFNDCRTESLAKSESRLLDSIASAEMQKEVESRVIKVVKAQSAEIEDQTGTKPSLTDDEIKEYLDEVLKEIKR